MKIRLELLTDTIFGSGLSVPGGEDIGVLTDEFGFPYVKGSSIKGIIREEWTNYLYWTGCKEVRREVEKLFGRNERVMNEEGGKIFVSDFTLPYEVKEAVLYEVANKPVKQLTRQEVNRYKGKLITIYTSLRTFTKLEEGVAKENTLRTARCINGGIILGGVIECPSGKEEELKEVLSLVKLAGTMRTRGFGQIRLSVV